jgi:Ca-activated chloride channel family protein
MRGSRANGTSYYVDGVRVGATSTSKSTSPEPEAREKYNGVFENAFKLIKNENTSIISTDVDRAAYANVRRFLNSGQLPPTDAVRSEEMINYFNYEASNRIQRQSRCSLPPNRLRKPPAQYRSL